MNDFLWNLIQDTYIFIIASWLLAAIFLGKKSRKAGHRHSHYRAFLMLSAAVYTLVLLYVTLLCRTAKTEYQMELSFLWEYRLALQGNFSWWMQIFDNIMLFLPMGWLYGGINDLKARNFRSRLGRNGSWKTALLFGLCASAAIELCQLVFKLGLFEFDDILNNGIGMMTGYGLYRIILSAKKL